jgi:hypothetical protein
MGICTGTSERGGLPTGPCSTRHSSRPVTSIAIRPIQSSTNRLQVEIERPPAAGIVFR